LKQFHARYTDVANLEELAAQEGRRNWASVHISRFRPYKNINPELPTLQPWINTTRAPSQRFVFSRNPFFHRIDENGLQLPYIDRVILDIASGKLIPAKTGAGESDLQARHLNFSNYTFLKKSEKRTGRKVLLWDTTVGSHIALYPNLNVEDPVWRELVRDVRFRRALSLAINRNEINQVIYYGFVREGNDTVFSDCPLFKPEYSTAWAEFDLKKANALLDEIGLTERNGEGLRLLQKEFTTGTRAHTSGYITRIRSGSNNERDTMRFAMSRWDCGPADTIRPLVRLRAAPRSGRKRDGPRSACPSFRAIQKRAATFPIPAGIEPPAPGIFSRADRAVCIRDPARSALCFFDGG